MKLKKLLVCVLVSAGIFGMTGAHTYAAETTDNTVVNEESNQPEAPALQNQETQGEANTETNVDEDAIIAEESQKVSEEPEEIDEIAYKAEKQENDKYTKAELRLLSSLIFCEAGSEPYAGKLAVGIVVMNRKASRNFPNTVKGVIYDKYQFGPARNGSLSRALSNYDRGRFTSSNEKDSIKAAKAALSGVKKVTYKGKTVNMNNYHYFSGRVSGARLTIANHQFK